MAELALPRPEPRVGPRNRAEDPAAAEERAGWLLAAPALLLLLALIVVPVLAAVVLSFTDWQLGSRQIAFIALDNYAEMLNDRRFRVSLGNTLLYVGVVAPFSVVLGLGLALLIEGGRGGRTLFRTIYFLPVVSLLVAMAVVWQYLMHPTIGPLNALLSLVGLPRSSWLAGSGSVMWSLCLIGVWENVGFNLVLFLAGLTAIPRELYAAAEIDGARGAWDRFRLVTFPMLGPTLLFVLAITTIRTVKVFETVAALTQGGPNRASEVLLWTIYQEAFVFFRSGYASALTVVFLVIFLVVMLVQTRLLEKRVHYG